uniref:Ferritin n=1 Tax=Mizuhopecten yessoensis TaxID=6573 RepID=W5U1X7_MIZYE|nr:ferritin [Mizuhopecten yessoensis]
MWVLGVFVASLAWLAYVGPGNSQIVEAESAPELLCGFDEVQPRSHVNRNIRQPFLSYYQYLAISYCFARHNVTLPGFEGLFRSYSEMELQNAEKLMGYMVKRGMTFDFHSINVHSDRFIQCYERDDTGETAWSYVTKVTAHVLKNQKDLLNKYKKTHFSATSHNFPHLKAFIEDEFMEQKYQKIKEIADTQTRLERIRTNNHSELGLYLFDRSLLS